MFLEDCVKTQGEDDYKLKREALERKKKSILTP